MLIRYDDQSQLSQFSILCNTGDGGLFSNIEANSNKGYPQIECYKAVEQPALIVGGGGSLASTLESIRLMKDGGCRVFALNNAAKYLFEHGIRPDVQIVLDSRPQNIEFVSERWAGEVLLASQCDPSLFAKCAEIGYPVRLWHPLIEGAEKFIPEANPLMIGGGLTVGLSGACLVYTLGHRIIHLFGYDSCHFEGKSHAYEQPLNATDEMIRVCVKDRVFYCSVTMAAQANAFQKVAEQLAERDCEIHLHGDGLIQYIAQQMTHEQKVLTAVYDLSVSPPTYDFISFLVEAEKARIAQGLEQIDVVFQPGPMHGFRDDSLPPSPAERAGMLKRICIPACGLLPSVRNVTVLKEQQPITADHIFPEGYTVESPISHYGTKYLKEAIDCLQSSQAARDYVKRRIHRPYATITLRESDYWPQRNSQRKEWVRVARWLEARGIEAVFIPDTSGAPVVGFENFHEASVDLDMRMALCEGAKINLSVSNGPTALFICSSVPYLIFKPVVQSVHSATAEFLAANGMEVGAQYPGFGRLVWESDEFEIIVRHIEQFLFLDLHLPVPGLLPERQYTHGNLACV